MSDQLASHVTRLASANPADVAAAAEALSHLGKIAQAAAAPLVRASCTADATARAWIAAALEELGPPPASQIEELTELASCSTSEVVFWAITLLGRAGEASAPAVATLTIVLRHSSELSLRERAAWALGKIGTPAVSAAPALHEAAASGSPRLARLAKTALEAVTG